MTMGPFLLDVGAAFGAAGAFFEGAAFLDLEEELAPLEDELLRTLLLLSEEGCCRIDTVFHSLPLLPGAPFEGLALGGGVSEEEGYGRVRGAVWLLTTLSDRGSWGRGWGGSLCLDGSIRGLLERITVLWSLRITVPWERWLSCCYCSLDWNCRFQLEKPLVVCLSCLLQERERP